MDLSSRARSVGFGGIGHHLGSLLAQFEAGAPPAALGETLETVTHMAGQARLELGPADSAGMQRAASGGGEPAPPPMMTMAGRKGSGAPGPGASGVVRSSGPESIRPPRLLDASQVIQGGAAPPPALHSLGSPAGVIPSPPNALQPLAPLGQSAPPLPALGQAPLPPVSPANFSAPPANFSAPPANFSAPPLAPPMVGNSPGLGSAPVPLPVQQGVFEIAPAPASVRGGAPNLLVRSMLGLRAFGRGGGAKADAAPPPVVQEPSAPQGGGLLGLGSGRREVTNSSGVARPPPLLDSIAIGAAAIGAVDGRLVAVQPACRFASVVVPLEESERAHATAAR
ncbi:MAG: hypothetical protein QM756_11720 [Polyangiaceae bacterium]